MSQKSNKPIKMTISRYGGIKQMKTELLTPSPDMNQTVTRSKLSVRQNLPNKTKSRNNRSRKNNGALKFHNFVANTQFTALPGSNNSSNGRGQQTSNRAAVEAHCLREEHGTKSICVSHWSKPIADEIDQKNASGEAIADVLSMNSEAPTTVVPKKSTGLVTGSVVELAQPPIAPIESMASVVASGSSTSQQQSILESLLARQSAAATADADKIIEREKKAHKRKPSWVRRVLRTSNNNDVVQDEPLDLSTNNKRQCIARKSIETLITANGHLHGNVRTHSERIGHRTSYSSGISRRSNVVPTPEPSDSIQNLIKSVEESAAQAASIMASVSGVNNHIPSVAATQHSYTIDRTPPPTVTHATLSFLQRNGIFTPHASQPNLKVTSTPYINNQRSSISQLVPTSTVSQVAHLNVPMQIQGQSLHQNQQHLANSHDQQNGSSAKKDKRQNGARSIIKQKLEDAFSNGFLVKTKQMTDGGGATFCKFRQLKKYTRYYLKSWHQHLPPELYSNFKGFLPPKTAKPSSSSSNQSTL